MLTERTIVTLTKGTLPEGVKSVNIPDASLDAEQNALTDKFKEAFNITDVAYTFRVGLDKEGNITSPYKPSVVAKDNELVISWGGKYFPLPAGASFAGGTTQIEVELDDIEYTLPVSINYIKAEDAITPTQKAFAEKPANQQADFLTKCFNKGTLHELTRKAFTPALKFSDIVGTNLVVDTRIEPRFGTTQLMLADGSWVKANAAITKKVYDLLSNNVEISKDKPAELTVKPSTKEVNGYPVYPATLVSFSNIDVDPFDFSQLV
jgi:hypothetical protein